ncbi:MAG TPA: hypothetical protein VFD99_08245 [Arthrobacter sp.]|jgi:hypothetical protein|nr:hypothetical protein [Arthrobacter sp.]
MLKKIAAGAFLAGALALSAAAPAVLSAGTTGDIAGITAVGNWPDPMKAPQAVGNWPDPMSNPASNKLNVGNWPDPMSNPPSNNPNVGNWPDPM